MSEPTLPRWLTSIESITPAKAGGLGVLLSAVNPKNLLLLVAGGLAIAQGATSTGDKAVAMVVFISSPSLPSPFPSSSVSRWVIGPGRSSTQ